MSGQPATPLPCERHNRPGKKLVQGPERLLGLTAFDLLGPSLDNFADVGVPEVISPGSDFVPGSHDLPPCQPIKPTGGLLTTTKCTRGHSPGKRYFQERVPSEQSP